MLKAVETAITKADYEGLIPAVAIIQGNRVVATVRNKWQPSKGFTPSDMGKRCAAAWARGWFRPQMEAFNGSHV